MFLNNYKTALNVLLKKPIMLWGLSLLLVLLTAIGTMLTALLPFLSIAVAFLFYAGSAKLFMDGLKGKEVNSKQLFAAFDKNAVKTAGAMAWQALWTVIWSGVPIYGIVKAYSYRFVPYIIMSRPEISAFDALKISMKMTEGKKMQMFLADLVAVCAPGVIGFILGLLGAIPFLGIIFRFASAVFVVAIALFGYVFVGLYMASFFNEEEIDQYIEAPAAE